MPSNHQPLLIAHRAGNRIRTLEAAAHAGADLIEVDVWFHRGRLEVGHDKTLGPIPLRWDRWSLGLGRRRHLALSDLLAALPSDAELFFDLKGEHPALPSALRRMVDELLPDQPFGVSSQNWSYLEPFLDVKRAQVIRSIGSKEALQQMLAEIDGWTGAGIGLHFELLTPEVITELRERTPLILTWTINNLDQAQHLVREGVGGIITDSLDLIRDMRADPVA